jgi:hypothetical protein
MLCQFWMVQATWLNFIPIKSSHWCTKNSVLFVVDKAFEFHLVIMHLPITHIAKL